jgi:chromate transporter
MIFLYLFITFFEIGLFGFGGGYAMISLIQGQVVTRWHWMSMQEFTNVIAISQMTPGPVGINSATYCGYTAVHNAGYDGVMAMLGSATATFALVLPSFIFMILISKMFMKYMKNPIVQSVFSGLRPAVVGLLGAAALLLMNAENFYTPADPWRFWISVSLFVFTFVGTKWLNINPIKMIGYAAFGGLMLLY